MKCSGKVGLILIGDELLNGSRQDKHMARVISLLQQRGLPLAWVRIVGDEQQQLVNTFRETLQTSEIVFSFGGIGATPDDITRPCSAIAAGVGLFRHPQLVAIIEKQFGEAAYPQRIRMSELPDGATLIPNPVNNIAGYKIAHHHFVPGFPDMAWPMIEWSLATWYSPYFDPEPPIERRWILNNVHESELIPMMEDLLNTFPDISLSSLPSTTTRHQVDLGLKGKQQAVEAAAIWLTKQMDREQISYSTKKQASA